MVHYVCAGVQQCTIFINQFSTVLQFHLGYDDAKTEDMNVVCMQKLKKQFPGPDVELGQARKYAAHSINTAVVNGY